MGFEVNIKEVRWEAMNWINLAWDREAWRNFVKTRMSLRFPRNLGNFLTRTGTNRSSRMTVLQGVGELYLEMIVLCFRSLSR
jgi:hypothetical protein